MVFEHPTFYGKVRNGIIVPEQNVPFPDGATVEIRLTDDAAFQIDMLDAELAAWNKASDDAWAMIENWEHEDTLGGKQA